MDKTLSILFVTTNGHKAREVEHFFNSLRSHGGPKFQVVIPDGLEEVDETGQTFMENAHIKAQSVTYPMVASLDFPCHYVMADDSGLVVPALSGLQGLEAFPGVRSNRWYEGNPEDPTPLVQQRNLKLLELMANISPRDAYYCCAVVLYQVNAERQQIEPCFEHLGTMELTVLAQGDSPRGTGGFGYDPIMMCKHPNFLGRTVAELSAHEKSQSSHRGDALRSVLGYFNQQNVSVV